MATLDSAHPSSVHYSTACDTTLLTSCFSCWPVVYFALLPDISSCLRMHPRLHAERVRSPCLTAGGSPVAASRCLQGAQQAPSWTAVPNAPVAAEPSAHAHRPALLKTQA